MIVFCMFFLYIWAMMGLMYGIFSAVYAIKRMIRIHKEKKMSATRYQKYRKMFAYANRM